MAKKKSVVVPDESTTPTNTPTITPEEVARAATNDPTLSNDTFHLGDRAFKIVDLSYDNYVKFLVKIKPMFDVIGRMFMQKQNVSVPGIDLPTPSVSVDMMLQYCLDDLPELVRLCCTGSDPEITVDEIKELGGNPFKLAEIVLKQIVRNNIIKDFSSFFAHLLPLMKAKPLQK